MLNLFLLIMKILLKQHKQGSITVSFGKNDIHVPLGFQPDQVWINIEPSVTVPVCNAAPDCFDTKIVKDGFVISCNLKSQHRTIKWLALK